MEAIAADPSHRLAITPLVDAHVHLDKAFSWEQFPNLAGTMQGALAANWREGEQRSAEQVFQRGSRALEQAWRYGLRALRSHVDSGGPCAEPSWEGLLELQRRWRGRVELQLVALAPLQHWQTPDGQRLRASSLVRGGDVLPHGLDGHAPDGPPPPLPPSSGAPPPASSPPPPAPSSASRRRIFDPPVI